MRISVLDLKLETLNFILIALCAMCGCATDYSWRSAVPEDARTVMVPWYVK